MELRRRSGEQHAQRIDALVEAATAGVERDAQRGELFFQPPEADAEDRPAARETVDRGDGLGDEQWVPVGQHGERGAET